MIDDQAPETEPDTPSPITDHRQPTNINPLRRPSSTGPVNGHRAAAPRKASDGAAISAKIRNALAFFRTLDGAPGVEVCCHGTTLYSSIYRYDFALLLQQ